MYTTIQCNQISKEKFKNYDKRCSSTDYSDEQLLKVNTFLNGFKSK